MNKEQRLHIADTIKEERTKVNSILAKLWDLEMYVRSQVENSVDVEHKLPIVKL